MGDAAGIEFVVYDGTALTLHRDGCLKEGDDDVDVFIESTDADKVQDALSQTGLSLNYHNVDYTRPDTPVTYFFRYEPNAGLMSPLDVYAGASSGDWLCDKQDHYAMPHSLMLPPKRKSVRVGDTVMQIPFPAKDAEFVTTMYGANWQVPLQGAASKSGSLHKVPIADFGAHCEAAKGKP